MRKSFQTGPALFAPSELPLHPAMKALDGLEALVDWGEVEALLPQGEGKAATGRPGYPALMLFRALLLGQLYPLPSLQLANPLMRDLLFRRFCGPVWTNPYPMPSHWVGFGRRWTGGWTRCWRW
jgi:IS5 family transposase